MTDAGRVLITGASSGIGLATAQWLLQRDYRIVGLSRRGQIDALAHDNFVAHPVDLADLSSIGAALDRLLADFEFDCLIHAAGAGHFGSIEQFSIAQIDASLRLNLTAAAVLCRALLPPMRRRRRGRIILIGSESALAAGKKGALYSAAKFGLRGLSQALREDCARDNIQVSLINPGMVRSPFFDNQSFAPGEAPENAIDVDDIAELVEQIMTSSRNIVYDEINLSPRIKTIQFSAKRNDD